MAAAARSAAAAMLPYSLYGGGADGAEDFATQICRLLGAALPRTDAATGSSSGMSSEQQRRLLEAAAAEDVTAAAAAAAAAALVELMSTSGQIAAGLSQHTVPGGGAVSAGDIGVYVAAVAVPLAGSGSGDAAAAATAVQVSAGPGQARAADSSGADPAQQRRRRLVQLPSQTSVGAAAETATAYIAISGAAATGAAGYSLALAYAPSADAALRAALASAPVLSSASQSVAAAFTSSNVTLLGGLATTAWVAGPGAAALPPSLDGISSYLQLRIPAPGYDARRTTYCLSYNATANVVTAGSAVSFELYDTATGQAVCRASEVGSVVVMQSGDVSLADQGPVLGDGAGPDTPSQSPASPTPANGTQDQGQAGAADTSPDARTRRGSTNVGAAVGGALGGVVGVALLAAAVVLVLRRTRRRHHTEVAVAPTPTASVSGGHPGSPRALLGALVTSGGSGAVGKWGHGSEAGSPKGSPGGTGTGTPGSAGPGSPRHVSNTPRKGSGLSPFAAKGAPGSGSESSRWTNLDAQMA